ncbi:hypothetical protein EK904_001570 [Melospiza melodia maxima]|nr:hypothetical protein EK904_001570 [Melospiza melodia maxima]
MPVVIFSWALSQLKADSYDVTRNMVVGMNWTCLFGKTVDLSPGNYLSVAHKIKTLTGDYICPSGSSSSSSKAKYFYWLFMDVVGENEALQQFFEVCFLFLICQLFYSKLLLLYLFSNAGILEMCARVL